MNFESNGIPLAIVKGTGSPKSPLLSLNDKDSNPRHTFNEINLEGSEIFQPVPNPKIERKVTYITGASGSGKSTFVYNYCCEYRKMYPKRNIYLFSALKEDSSLDKIKGLKRIKITPEFLEESISAEDFNDSMVIFDDCDTISDKKTKLKILGIMNSLLETGRHFKCDLCITSHLACSGSDTKRVLNEAHEIVFFPHSIGAGKLKYFLENYTSLDKKKIEMLKHLKTRWICITKTYPPVILTEKNAFIPSLV